MLLMQLYVKIGDILTDLHDHIISLRVTLFIFHQNLSFSTKEKSITSKTSLTVLIMCESSPCMYHCLASTTHGTDQFSYECLWYVIPLLYKGRHSSSKVSGGFKPFRTRRPSSSHKCLMSFKSGDNAGHGRVWI
jgi:hypothetical protein